MNQNSQVQFFPKITGNPINTSQPKWSVMIPVCNRVKYLRQAIESVLAQDPGPRTMQICIVDNSTEQIDWNSWLKPSERDRIEVFKQPEHLPLVANWNSCVEHSRGEFVHILHDDDYVLDGFYQKIAETATEHPQCGAYFMRCVVIDEMGGIEYLSKRVPDLEIPTKNPGNTRYTNELLPPGVVVRRSAYEKLGGFDSRFVFCPDWQMWLRIITELSGIHINHPLAAYRWYGANGTIRLAQNADNLRDCLQLADWIEKQDPEFDRRKFNDHIANWASYQMHKFQAAGNESAADANELVYKQLITATQRTFATRINHFIRRVGGAIKHF